MGEVARIEPAQQLPASYVPALSPAQLRDQVNAIQHAMQEVMKDGTHFGKIPGCGDKPALLKPGAEKICLMFRLALSLDVRQTDLPGGHREYTVISKLTSREGTIIAEGVGICSTMESKYRYRWENTGEVVPKNYWDDRDPQKIGGPAFAPRKINGTWIVFHKVEHDNPADYYNTVVKMAKKRSHVDATLTGTAASDIFEQDLEEADVAVEREVHDSRDPKARPGKVANAKNAAEGDPEKRAQLIEQLEAKAEIGMASLTKAWGELTEGDRELVGAEFGRIKKKAQAGESANG